MPLAMWIRVNVILASRESMCVRCPKVTLNKSVQRLRDVGISGFYVSFGSPCRPFKCWESKA
jgi:hypothetical protein